MIRITVDSDRAGEGVSTLALYISTYLKDIFDKVRSFDPETDQFELIPDQQRQRLHALIKKQPEIEVIAHPRLAALSPPGRLVPLDAEIKHAESDFQKQVRSILHGKGLPSAELSDKQMIDALKHYLLGHPKELNP